MGFLLDWFEVELLSVLVNYTKLSTIKWSVKILCEYGSFSIDVCLFTINIFIAPTEAIIADINVCLPEIKHWDAFVLILVTDIQQSFKLIQLFIRTESFCNKNWFAWGNSSRLCKELPPILFCIWKQNCTCLRYANAPTRYKWSFCVLQPFHPSYSYWAKV